MYYKIEACPHCGQNYNKKCYTILGLKPGDKVRYKWAGSPIYTIDEITETYPGLYFGHYRESVWNSLINNTRVDTENYEYEVVC
jgi:hypothetical protein